MATTRQIIISKEDHERLESFFAGFMACAFREIPYLQSLRDELDIATILPSNEIPADVVTMNSTVRMREVGSKRLDTYTLVYPEDAYIAEDKLSVLAPIGIALLGHRVGDQVQWRVPSGLTRFVIEELVYQPERDELFGCADSYQFG